MKHVEAKALSLPASVSLPFQVVCLGLINLAEVDNGDEVEAGGEGLSRQGPPCRFY